MYRGTDSRTTWGRVTVVWMRGLSSLDDFLFDTVTTVRDTNCSLPFTVCVCTHLLHEIRYCPVATVLLLLLGGGHRRQKHSLAHSPVCKTTDRTNTHHDETCSSLIIVSNLKIVEEKALWDTVLQLGWSLRRVAAHCQQLQWWWGQQERPRRWRQDVCHQQEGDVHHDLI